MKVLVPVKRVVDANVKVRVKPDGTGMDLANVKMAVNPFCEIGIEEAVRLKEADIATEVIAISVGGSQCQEQLRTCLALGADRAILVETDEELEPLAIAKVLVAIYEKEQPGIVIFGKQSIDSDNGQTGQMFAALTGIAQGTFASELSITNGKAEVVREIDGGKETVTAKLPLVVGGQKGIVEESDLRIPNMRGIMMARKKPLEVKEPQGASTETSAVSFEKPAPKGDVKLISPDNLDELIDLLHNEAKAI